jgi:hypothetical protein
MEAGNLSLAQNYLDQADSLDPNNAFIQNAKGQLLLQRAIKAPNKATAILLRDSGSDILMANINNPELDDAYCYHIYGLLRLNWLRVWGEDYREKHSELTKLRQLAQKAFRKYPRDRRIMEMQMEVEREYLLLAVRD